jgi:hypothetical protein
MASWGKGQEKDACVIRFKETKGGNALKTCFNKANKAVVTEI